MEQKKYELTSESITLSDGTRLYRIKALRDFGNVNAGDLGGFIEKEGNLSHSGNAWVCGNARVYGNARVGDNARVCDEARVCDDTWVGGNARVCDDTWVGGNAWVYGNARVGDNARVCDDTWVGGNAWVYGNARVGDNARVCDDTWVGGNARVGDDARVCGNARIETDNDLCLFGYFGSLNRTTTAFKTRDGGIGIRCGCFYGTLDEFRQKVKETHRDNDYAREYLMIADLIEHKLAGRKGN